MTDRPENIRIATHGDEKALYDFIAAGHHESAIFPMSCFKVNQLIDAAISRTHPIIIGVIDAPDKNEIAASICIIYEQLWYTDHWTLNELWNNVRPDHRRSNYAKDLIQFAKWVAETTDRSLNIGIVTTERMEAKIRLYKRQLKQTGAYFMYNMKAALGPAATEKYSSLEVH